MLRLGRRSRRGGRGDAHRRRRPHHLPLREGKYTFQLLLSQSKFSQLPLHYNNVQFSLPSIIEPYLFQKTTLWKIGRVLLRPPPKTANELHRLAAEMRQQPPGGREAEEATLPVATAPTAAEVAAEMEEAAATRAREAEVAAEVAKVDRAAEAASAAGAVALAAMAAASATGRAAAAAADSTTPRLCKYNYYHGHSFSNYSFTEAQFVSRIFPARARALSRYRLNFK